MSFMPFIDRNETHHYPVSPGWRAREHIVLITVNHSSSGVKQKSKRRAPAAEPQCHLVAIGSMCSAARMINTGHLEGMYLTGCSNSSESLNRD